MIKTKCTHSDFVLANKLTAKSDITTTITAKSDEHTDHYWLYALQLEEYNYYVGVTTESNPYTRIKQHGGFFGTKWTRLHKPKRVLEIRDLSYISAAQAKDVEQKLTAEYMNIYGEGNVRGGLGGYRERCMNRLNSFFTTNDYYALIVVATLLLVIAALSVALVLANQPPPAPIPR